MTATPGRMRAVVMHATGGPEVLVVEARDVPDAPPGGVLVRLARAGVNFADTERRRGLYEPVPLPWVPGSEGSGTVVAVGAGADASLLGRRVAVLARPARECSGTYAEYATAPAGRVIPIPDALDDDVAAAFPMQALTAWHAQFTVGGLAPGETVLVHAAAGGVGLWAVQLARRAGARALGVVSSAAKGEAVRRAGGEPLVRDASLAEAIRDATGGRGVALVLDSVGADTAGTSLAALAPFGRLVFVGEASGPPPPVEVDALYDRSLRVGAYWLWTAHAPAERARALEVITGGLLDGSLAVTIDAVLPLAEAPAAHRRLESRASVGKVLLAVR